MIVVKFLKEDGDTRKGTLATISARDFIAKKKAGIVQIMPNGTKPKEVEEPKKVKEAEK